jgi:hypothetical protein
MAVVNKDICMYAVSNDGLRRCRFSLNFTGFMKNLFLIEDTHQLLNMAFFSYALVGTITSFASVEYLCRYTQLI